jgi:hypothetical protein
MKLRNEGLFTDNSVRQYVGEAGKAELPIR